MQPRGEDGEPLSASLAAMEDDALRTPSRVRRGAAVAAQQVARAVGNVRMTDSFLEMLGRADAITAARAAIASAWTDGGVLVVPAVRFRGVRFTSGSR